MARLLWDAQTDVAASLAELLRDQFGQHAPAAARCLFALERAMLPQFWIRSYVAKRLQLLTLRDKREPFWCWGKHFSREEFLRVGEDLALARAAVAELPETARTALWAQQVEYAEAMHQLYVHALATYESARRDGRWHFSPQAGAHFSRAVEQLRRLAAVDLPRWSRNVHYYERSLLEQTAIGPALERMSANLGIALLSESSSFSSSSIRFKTVWTHGGERPLQVGLGNYQWGQPCVCGDRVFVTGLDKESSPARSILRCLDLKDGVVVWEHICEDAGHSALLSTYLGVGANSIFARECHKNPARSSLLIRLDAATGKEIWRVADPPDWEFGGNGAALVLDLDGDGRLEVIDSAVAHIACLDLETGKTKWRYADQIKICHGVTAAADVDGDGRLELVIGGEYNECGRTSSIQVLRADELEAIGITSGRDGGFATKPAIVCLDAATGKERWRTPIPRHYIDDDLRLVADFDGDGLPEALLFTAHQSGYGHVAGQPSWCDAYIVNGQGVILWKLELEDLSYAALVGDVPRPAGLVIATGSGLVRRLQF